MQQIHNMSACQEDVVQLITRLVLQQVSPQQHIELVECVPKPTSRTLAVTE